MGESKRWSPMKAALITALFFLIFGAIAAGIVGGISDDGHDPEQQGERIGRALALPMIAAAVIAYFVQKSRLADKK